MDTWISLWSAPAIVQRAHLEDDRSNTKEFNKVFEFPVIYSVKNYKFLWFDAVVSFYTLLLPKLGLQAHNMN